MNGSHLHSDFAITIATYSKFNNWLTHKSNLNIQTYLLAFLMIGSNIALTQNSFGQFSSTQLDSLRSYFPIDSSYSLNILNVHFRPFNLDLEKLCFTYSSYKEKEKKVTSTFKSDFDNKNLQSILAKHRFYVKDIVTDTLLANFLITIGADSLSPMTFEILCLDILNTTSLGNTIPIQDYLFVKLHFKNNNSIPLAINILKGNFNSKIYDVSPEGKLTYR